MVTPRLAWPAFVDGAYRQHPPRLPAAARQSNRPCSSHVSTNMSTIWARGMGDASSRNRSKSSITAVAVAVDNGTTLGRGAPAFAPALLRGVNHALRCSFHRCRPVFTNPAPTDADTGDGDELVPPLMLLDATSDPRRPVLAAEDGAAVGCVGRLLPLTAPFPLRSVDCCSGAAALKARRRTRCSVL